MRTLQDVLSQLRGEYRDMPGLRLTQRQVQRLCGIDPTICQLALDVLVKEGFLSGKPDGHYARAGHGQAPRLRVAKRELVPADRATRAS